MDIIVGSILQFTQTIGYNGGQIINRHRYMCTEGTLSWLKAQAEACIAAFKAKAWDIQKDLVIEEVTLLTNKVQPIYLNTGIAYAVSYDPAVEKGTDGNLAAGFMCQTDSRAAAVLERRSYVPGRQGVGRSFIGPVMRRYMDQKGNFLPLQLNAGDAKSYTNLSNALAMDITVNNGGQIIQLRPCLVNNDPVTSTLDDILRSSYWGPIVTYHESRRWGRGS